MSVLTDLIYGGSNAVAGLTESAVQDAIAKYGAEKKALFPILPISARRSMPLPGSRCRSWVTFPPALRC